VLRSNSKHNYLVSAEDFAMHQLLPSTVPVNR